MSFNSKLIELLKNSIKSNSNFLAIKDRHCELTYFQVESAVDECIKRLRSCGLKNGHIMLIHQEKSTDFLIVMLACIFSGIIYVPLDESIPPERIKAIAHETGAFAIYHDNGKLLKFDSKTTYLKKGVLIFYTSGSTGKPKAVLIPENNIISFVFWAIKKFEINSFDRISSFSPWHFDLSIFDIFASLFTGSSIHCFPNSLKVFPVQIYNWIIFHKISIIYMVPTVIRSLVNLNGFSSIDSTILRCILFAGEPYPLIELLELRRKFPTQLISNLYGPTETNVCSYKDIPQLSELNKWKVCPIGSPLPGFEFLIGNNQHEGELICIGNNISLGYLNDPESENFIKVNNIPAYRTGDLATITDNGYVFLGRTDRQIKFLGHRIDPFEIESILRLCSFVNDAAVCFDKNRITAFLVCEKYIDENFIFNHCSKYLSKASCPRKFIFINSIPKTLTEKVDYKSLLSLV
ncbi:AMP-binding protein [Marinomonas sp. TI.3.20]|uniref:AMP-binding protein n=1 Tax=Marinomonas sp. TI.3.20 TaxID=3121296 RepID=UPI00311F3154